MTGQLALAPLVLFAIVFFWTPPHTWALAMRYREDYAAAEVPMLPVVRSSAGVACADRRLLGDHGCGLAGAVAGRRHRLALPGRCRGCRCRAAVGVRAAAGPAHATG